MRIFVSSRISGMEEERAHAKRAIQMLGHQAVMAEDFGARATSPRVACLSGVREADLIVLILGPRYGAAQASGLSATHEEFREARGRKPVLTFVQAGESDSEQRSFIDEASGWEPGVFWAPYSMPQELGEKIAGAIHRFAIANATAPLDPAELKTRAAQLIPERRRDASATMLTLAVAVGPTQTILRPTEIEDRELRERVQQRVLFGQHALFDLARGTQAQLEDGVLVVRQEGRWGADPEVRLWETGDVAISVPDRTGTDHGMSAVIEEEITRLLNAAISFVSWHLEQIDASERLTHVVLAAQVSGGGASFGWRTRAEHAASPSSGSVMMFGEENRSNPVMLNPPHLVRQALTMNTGRIVEDLVALLRRQWRSGGSGRSR